MRNVREVDNDVSHGHSVQPRLRFTETPVQTPPEILCLGVGVSKETTISTLHLLLSLKMPASDVTTWPQT
jgi:hypothetical protein